MKLDSSQFFASSRLGGSFTQIGESCKSRSEIHGCRIPTCNNMLHGVSSIIDAQTTRFPTLIFAEANDVIGSTLPRTLKETVFKVPRVKRRRVENQQTSQVGS